MARPGLHTLKLFFRIPSVDDRAGAKTHMKRQEGPVPVQTPDDSFWGEWLPTKEDPEKENSMRTWVGAGGRGTQ